MNFIFENFDLSWFLTTPGILTGLGCLLIIISIIIFISSLVGGKKEKKEAEVVSEAPAAPVQADATPVQTVAEPAPVVASPTDTPSTVEPVVTTQTASPVESPVETSVEPQVASVNIEPTVSPVAPVAEPLPTVEATATSPAEPTSNVTPIEVTTESVSANTPITDPKTIEPTFTGINIEPKLEPLPATPKEETPVTNLPYNGESLKVEEVVTNPEPKVIYGGADPLAGTGIMPSVGTGEAPKKEDIESL